MPSTTPKQRSRADRWRAACSAARAHAEALADARAALVDALGAVKEVQDEYQEWYDNMPESLQQSPTGEKLSALCDIALDEDDDVDAMLGALDEAEEADLPLGFGRD